MNRCIDLIFNCVLSVYVLKIIVILKVFYWKVRNIFVMVIFFVIERISCICDNWNGCKNVVDLKKWNKWYCFKVIFY